MDIFILDITVDGALDHQLPRLILLLNGPYVESGDVLHLLIQMGLQTQKPKSVDND